MKPYLILHQERIMSNPYKDVFREHDFMARGFVSAIVNDTPAEPTFRDGARIQRYLEAAFLSAQEGGGWK
jgi:predicted dehydrogenase